MKMTKRLLSVLLSLVLMLGLIPTMSLTALAAATSYNVWIGGVEVTSDNSSGTGWSYDSDSNTLTLNGYQNSGNSYKYENSGKYAAIYAKQDLTISLTGESTVTVNEKSMWDDNHGVFVDGKLTIQGEGQVTVNGKTSGIRSKSLQIDSGTVNASCDGTFPDASIYITEDGNGLTINGGNVTASGKKGIKVGGGDVSITGGTVNAVGSGYQGYGISVDNGDVTISGGEVTAISTSTSDSSYRNGIIVDGSGKKLTIGASVTSVIVSGTDGAVRGNVVNAVAGIGWNNKEGTGTATDINISTSARKLNYMKAQFPAPPAYMEATVDETTHEVTFSKKTCTDYTKVTDSTTAVTWNAGWYVVNSNAAISERITVSGTVNLILCDNCTLTASKGITVGRGNTLNIYAQSNGENMGTLTANGPSDSAGAGIGGNQNNTGGTLNIHGGAIVAIGGKNSTYGAAGIGGGSRQAGGNITIYGGTVNATGNQYGAGIGGGGYSNAHGLGGAGGTVTIYGGTVTARGGSYASGIGGGWGGFIGDPSSFNSGAGGAVTIYGGTVTAVGNSTVGIGGGRSKNSHGTLELGEGMYLYSGSVTPANAVKPNDGAYSRSGTMIIEDTPPHTHDYQYAASDAVITLTCSGTRPDFCNLPQVDNVPTATLTINPPGEGIEATIEASAEGTFDATKISPISYKTRGADSTWPEESTTTAPSGNGFHQASFTYDGTYTAAVTYGLNCVTYVNGDNAHGTVSGSANATVGATITPTITPNTGYEIDTLTVVKTGTTEEVEVTNNESFVMPETDVTVSATFKKINSAITVTQPTNGTVTAKQGDTDVTTADYGDTITLGNSPAAGYDFTSYSVTKTGDSTTVVPVNNGTFTMPAYPVTVTGTFTPIDYTLTFTDMTNGTVSAAKTNGLHIGDEVTLTATPNTGYALTSLSVNGTPVSPTAGENNTYTYTFTMSDSDVTVSATFTAIPYHVTVAGPFENGTVTTATTPEDVVHIGDKVTLTVTPDEGYGLKSITTSAGTLVQTALDEDTGVLTYELTIGAADATVSAEFDELTTYTVFYNASGTPDTVSVKLEGGETSYAMKNSAKLGNINCWSTQVLGGAGSTSLTYAVKEGNGEWTTLNIPVVSEVPNTLAAGSAVAIAGEANAFVVAFAWGEEENDNRYYLVTSNTASLDVPNPANTNSETFTGWTYLVPSAQAGGEAEEVTVNKADGNATTVQLNKITQTTIASAIWTPNSYTVSIDPDNGSSATTQSVTYGAKVTKPDTPTKAGYEFAGWVLAKDTVEKIGNKKFQLSAGTAFDFDKTDIINDLYLKAKWKHVHAYACLQLDDPVFGGAFKDYYGYKGQLHIKLCTSMDDYSVEAHSFVNGRCACGASILDNKVKLTEYVGGSKSEIEAVKNSIVSIIAPQNQGSQRFGKWQYSADGQNWRDLTAMRGVAFSIPADMSVKAVYESEPFKLSINSFKYRDKYIAFQFDYSVPDGFTVVDGGLMIGDNVGMKFWDCTIKSFLGNQYEPSLRDAVSVYGGGTIANKMMNYQTINEPGLATPIKKPLATFGKTGTTALAWQPYDLNGYNKAINAHGTVKNYNQQTYPTYAMGYIICKTSQGGYVGFMTNAISATLESPAHSHVTTIPVS